MVVAAAIDIELLRRNAYDGTSEQVLVDRAWLQGIHEILTGKPFADVSHHDSVARELRILGAIDGAITRKDIG